jgi:hypothetical protein
MRLMPPHKAARLKPRTPLSLQQNTLPIIDAVRASGITDLCGIATALNARGVSTARGGHRHVSNVKNLIDQAFS